MKDRKKLIFDDNKLVGKIYEFVNLNYLEVYETKGFGIIRYLDSGREVFCTFQKDGKVLKEYRKGLYEIALNSNMGLDELSRLKADKTSNPNLGSRRKESRKKQGKNDLFYKLAPKESVENSRKLFDDWWAENARLIEADFLKKEERLNKKNVALTKHILNEKRLPKDRTLWPLVAEKIISATSFNKFDIKKFGIRLFVN